MYLVKMNYDRMLMIFDTASVFLPYLNWSAEQLVILDRVHIAVAARDDDAVFDIVETLHGHENGRGREGDALQDGGAARLHDQHLRRGDIWRAKLRGEEQIKRIGELFREHNTTQGNCKHISLQG
jgi:hypothetical protein